MYRSSSLLLAALSSTSLSGGRRDIAIGETVPTKRVAQSNSFIDKDALSNMIKLIKRLATMTIFAVLPNYKNLRILSITLRPYLNEWIIEGKLSSRSRISEASFAISVPLTPIATPISAVYKAKTSVAFDPVTAVT